MNILFASVIPNLNEAMDIHTKIIFGLSIKSKQVMQILSSVGLGYLWVIISIRDSQDQRRFAHPPPNGSEDLFSHLY